MAGFEYRLIQFVPSELDVLRVTIGIYVYGTDDQWLQMLAPDDLRRRCNTLVNSEPGRGDHLVQSLRAYERTLVQRGGQSVLDAEFETNLPELLANPERYNNLIQLSESFGAVGRTARDTADFLLRSLAPVPPIAERAGDIRSLRRDIRSRANAHPVLAAAMVEAPRLQLPIGQQVVSFGFVDGDAAVLTDVMNFAGLEANRNREHVRAFAYAMQSVRSGDVSITSEQRGWRIELPDDIPVHVVYSTPETTEGYELVHELQETLRTVDVDAVPAERLDDLLADTARVISGHSSRV